MIGEVVDSYRIVSRLGAGGMGAVWLAEHTLLGRRVAIKFLLPEISQNQAIVDRFFSEARAATRIADPGIVVVYDFGWHHNGAAYIVMEHLPGESLQARLRRGRFAALDAVRVVQQAALAMAVAHGAGIIHRDLKPDNLFLIPDPVVAGGERVKILDFGIAKLLGDEHGNLSRTRTGLIMGTPTYMSPEQCRGAGDVDHRTDIYALGGVLFHLLCGRLPFVASSPGDMIAAHLREAPPPPSAVAPDVPRALDDIVMRCLAKQADERFASMTELARALAAATGGAAAYTEIVSIAPLLAGPRDRPSAPGAPMHGPHGHTSPVPHGATTVATGLAPTDPSAQPQPSTFSRSAGEATPLPARGGRLAAGVVALLALGAIVTTIVIATRAPSGPSPARAPAGTGAPLDAATDAALLAPPDAAPDARALEAPPRRRHARRASARTAPPRRRRVRPLRQPVTP